MGIRDMRGALYRRLAQPKKQAPAGSRTAAMLHILRSQGLSSFYIEPAKQFVSLPSPGKIKVKTVVYPLLKPYAFAHIKYDAADNTLVYNLVEPKLSESEEKILAKLKEGMIQVIDVSLEDIRNEKRVMEFLEANVRRLLDEYSYKLSQREYTKIMYYIYRDFVGLNRIEPLFADPFIEDIGCDGTSVPVYIVHQKFGSLRTNIAYKSEKELRDFVTKLAERCNRYISYAEPLLDGTLPDGSRVQATLAADVTTRGPTFSIRKFKEEPFSPVDLIRMNTASPELLAYLWYVVENGINILISGGVATGKTTFLNAVSLFIQPEAKIISIEDTRELNLPHENWLPGVSRAGFTGTKVGEVSMFELLRESFRQNPDYLIVGEIRGKEAYVMFQGMASIPGTERVAVLNDDHMKFVPIGELAGKAYRTFAVDPETGKIDIASIKARVSHRPQKKLLRIKTRSGREITVTPYHSLFTFDGGIRAIEAGKLRKGSRIVIPAKLPAGFADIAHIDLTELDDARIFAPEYFRKAAGKLGYEKASRICNVRSISDYYANFRHASPASMKKEKFFALMDAAGMKADRSKLHVKFLRKSRPRPALLPVSSELLRLLGYYISEGTLNRSGKNSRIALYNKNKEILDDMRHCLAALGVKHRERVTDRGFGTATELAFSDKVIFEFLRQSCGHGSGKHVPDFVFGLSKEKIGEFLSSLFAGDGYYSRHGFGYCTSLRPLADQLAYLLLAYGIVARIHDRKGRSRAEKEYEVRFYRRRDREEFLRYARPIGKKAAISDSKTVAKNDYYADTFIDRVKSVEEMELEKAAPVYDLVVPGVQNFLGGFGGVVLHNSGHPSISTMHAGSVEDVIRRLQTKPISLSVGLLEILDVIIIMVHAREKGKSARRIKEISEIQSIDAETGTARTVKSFVWIPHSDTYEYRGNSWVLSKISRDKGVPLGEVVREIARRRKVIEWMYQSNVTGIEKVAKYISLYYRNQEAMMKIVEGKALPEDVE